MWKKFCSIDFLTGFGEAREEFGMANFQYATSVCYLSANFDFEMQKFYT